MRDVVRLAVLKAVVFAAVVLALLAITGPLLGLAAALTGTARIPVWVFSMVFSSLVLAATALALRLDGDALRDLGLTPTRRRLYEFSIGLALGIGSFAALALVRGLTVGASWSFASREAVPAAVAGIGIAFVLMFPEELMFRGYAFRRLLQVFGTWPTILISSALFGLYHLVGTQMWGMGLFFRGAMPALGGVVFGWAAVRTRGLALPIGLHLGGNWVQASVLSFGSGAADPQALWTAHVPALRQPLLYSPDLATHIPYIVTLALTACAVHFISPRRSARLSAS